PAEVPKRPRDEQHDEEACQRDRLDRVLDELGRERGAHDRRIGDLRVRTECRLEVLVGRDQLRREHLRRSDLDPTAGHTLDGRLVMSVRSEERLYSGVVRSRGERDLEKRAAFELDTRPQTTDREEEHPGHDQQRREQEVPPLPLDKMEKHPSTLTKAQYFASALTVHGRRLPL